MKIPWHSDSVSKIFMNSVTLTQWNIQERAFEEQTPRPLASPEKSKPSRIVETVLKFQAPGIWIFLPRLHNILVQKFEKKLASICITRLPQNYICGTGAQISGSGGNI